MKSIPILAAVAAHYLLGAYFDNAASDFPKLLVLMAICLNVCTFIKQEFVPPYIPSWLTFSEAVLFSFAVIEGGFITWVVIEKVATFLYATIVNEESSNEGLNKMKLILTILALIFFIQACIASLSCCPSCKSMLKFYQKVKIQANKKPKNKKLQITKNLECCNERETRPSEPSPKQTPKLKYTSRPRSTQR